MSHLESRILRQNVTTVNAAQSIQSTAALYRMIRAVLSVIEFCGVRGATLVRQASCLSVHLQLLDSMLSFVKFPY